MYLLINCKFNNSKNSN